MRKFEHFDGSQCKLDNDVWVITKVRNPKLGSGPIGERLGDPCPYCNRFQEDTVRRGWLRYWFYRMRSLARLQFTGVIGSFIVQGFALGQIFGLIIDLSMLTKDGLPRLILVDIVPLPLALLLGYWGWDYDRWYRKRNGAPMKS